MPAVVEAWGIPYGIRMDVPTAPSQRVLCGDLSRTARASRRFNAGPGPGYSMISSTMASPATVSSANTTDGITR